MESKYPTFLQIHFEGEIGSLLTCVFFVISVFLGSFIKFSVLFVTGFWHISIRPSCPTVYLFLWSDVRTLSHFNDRNLPPVLTWGKDMHVFFNRMWHYQYGSLNKICSLWQRTPRTSRKILRFFPLAFSNAYDPVFACFGVGNLWILILLHHVYNISFTPL